MAISLSSRLGLTRWGAGTDPLSRAQLDGDHSKLDSLAAMDVQVATLAERPAASIRGRYCWVVADRQLFRDDGTAWHRMAETGTDGAQLFRRANANEKPAADAPGTYPLGMSSHTVTTIADWPSANVMVVTQRPSGSRAQQFVSHATSGRIWVRTQRVDGDSWGRFFELVETLRFTSTTRPTTDLHDGMRGFETDTLATVVWQAGANRWVYETELRFTSTTRPTINLYDGLRGFETDTLTGVVWSASANRWIYESELRFTSSTRPTTGLYDGLRGFETDRLTAVVYQSALSRWIYESPLRITSTARPTTNLYDGLTAIETDTGLHVVYRTSDSRWIYQSPLRITSGSRPTTNLYEGLRAYETDTTGTIVRRGTTWVYEGFVTPPSCSLYRTADQSIPNGTGWTTATWTAEEWDTAGMHAANAAAVVVPHAGFYRVRATAAFEPALAGARRARIMNGAAEVRGSYAIEVHETSVFASPVHTSARVLCDAGDQLTLEVSQNSGAAIGLLGTGTAAFEVTWDGSN